MYCPSKGPLQMSVADLGPSSTELLACRTVLALHQSRVGEKVLHSRKAVDVLDLVRDSECQDLPDTGDGAESVIG